MYCLKPRKRKFPTREKAIGTHSCVNSSATLRDQIGHSRSQSIVPDDRHDFRDRIEAFAVVVSQQRMALKDFLLVLEEDSDP